jgi:hypothetical protein
LFAGTGVAGETQQIEDMSMLDPTFLKKGLPAVIQQTLVNRFRARPELEHVRLGDDVKPYAAPPDPNKPWGPEFDNPDAFDFSK